MNSWFYFEPLLSWNLSEFINRDEWYFAIRIEVSEDNNKSGFLGASGALERYRNLPEYNFQYYIDWSDYTVTAWRHRFWTGTTNTSFWHRPSNGLSVRKIDVNGLQGPKQQRERFPNLSDLWVGTTNRLLALSIRRIIDRELPTLKVSKISSDIQRSFQICLFLKKEFSNDTKRYCSSQEFQRSPPLQQILILTPGLLVLINHHHKLEHQGSPLLHRPTGPKRGNAEAEEPGRRTQKGAEECPAEPGS